RPSAGWETQLSQVARLRLVEVHVRFVFRAVAAEDAGQILGESRARHHYIAASLLSFDFQIALNMRDEADDRRRLLEPGAQFGNHGQGLDVVAVQVDDDQRRILFAFFLDLVADFLVALDELHFDVQLARHFLDFSQKEQSIEQAEDARGRFFSRGKGLKVIGALQAVMESIPLPAILIAVAVIHGADEGRVTALSAIVAALPVIAVLPAALAALLALGILPVMSEIAFPTPLLTLVGTV